MAPLCRRNLPANLRRYLARPAAASARPRRPGRPAAGCREAHGTNRRLRHTTPQTPPRRGTRTAHPEPAVILLPTPTLLHSHLRTRRRGPDREKFAPAGADFGAPRGAGAAVVPAPRKQEARSPPCRKGPGIYLAASYSRRACRPTTIGAAAFHFRVRNGTGWFRRAMTTRKPASHPADPRRPRRRASIRSTISGCLGLVCLSVVGPRSSPLPDIPMEKIESSFPRCPIRRIRPPRKGGPAAGRRALPVFPATNPRSLGPYRTFTRSRTTGIKPYG